jgi:hypothetical protein
MQGSGRGLNFIWHLTPEGGGLVFIVAQGERMQRVREWFLPIRGPTWLVGQRL